MTIQMSNNSSIPTTPDGHRGHESEPTYSVTKKELDMIKNDCAYPERQFCDGCEYADGEDTERASGLGCNFIGANALMDEVLTRKQPSAEHSYQEYECWKKCPKVKEAEQRIEKAIKELEKLYEHYEKQCCRHDTPKENESLHEFHDRTKLLNAYCEHNRGIKEAISLLRGERG